MLRGSSAPQSRRDTKGRKSHTKSRNGCGPCKSRRVKCDEQGPPCVACSIRGLKCEYALHVPSASSTTVGLRQTSTRDHSVSQSSPEIYAPLSSEEDSQLLDLELMHQFTAFTYRSMSVPTVNEDTWQVFVPRQALRHNYLMHAVLGLAALQLSEEDTHNREKYRRISLDHQNRGFAGFSETLSKINEDNCHAMFAFATIAMIFALASPQEIKMPPDDHNGDNKDFLSRVFLLCDFLQGIATVADAGRQWIRNGPFGVFVDDDNSIPLGELDADDQTATDRLHRFNDKFLSLVDPSAHKTIVFAIQQLEKCMRGGEMMALGWLAMCGRPFMTLLGQHQRLAQLVFMHWTLVLNRLNRIWWVRGTAKLWFDGVSSELISLGPEWREAVEDINSKWYSQGTS